jgi:ribonuclease R
LRSMQQAVYSAENVGHFGLAFPAYTHFTSPIRRYPDLIVHRIVKHILADGTPADLHYSPSGLQAAAEHCSGTERRADEATRDAESWLKCEYMQDKLGEDFDGTITSVTSFGIFVELDEVYVDGLVHITALDNDYYHFDPIGHRLAGERTGTVYRLGDRLRVKVAAVNLDERKIDFVPIARTAAPKGAGKGANKPTGKGAGKGPPPVPTPAQAPMQIHAKAEPRSEPAAKGTGTGAGERPAVEARPKPRSEPRAEAEHQEAGGRGRRRGPRSEARDAVRTAPLPTPSVPPAPAHQMPVRPAPEAQAQPDAHKPPARPAKSRPRGEPEVAALTSWPRGGESSAPAAEPAQGKGRRGRREPEVAALMAAPSAGRNQAPAQTVDVPADEPAASEADAAPAKPKRRRRRPAKPSGGQDAG